LLSPSELQDERHWLEEFRRRRSGSEDQKDRSEFTNEEPTFIVRCASCGTVFRNPQPRPEELRRRYSKDTYGRPTLLQMLEDQREFFRRKADAVHLSGAARVLEVGAFVGAFLIACKEKGWNALGLDVGDETCSFMNSLGLSVLQSDLEHCHLEPSSYDAIFIWNTFDQLANPADALRHIRSLAKPNATIVIRIPNGAFETACVLGRSNARRNEVLLGAQAHNNFLTFPYQNGYTADSICKLLESEGFKAIDVVGDTILPLTNKHSPDWAIEEERRFQRGVLRVCKQVRSSSGEILYPWMDVFSRANC
jgi:2-polyprenyl-3-methyl-5-hydroxy-6-metoxy-1,4-benzoquinol methylase